MTKIPKLAMKRFGQCSANIDELLCHQNVSFSSKQKVVLLLEIVTIKTSKAF